MHIHSIEIIKGSAAAALYGSRAANGVIQITTERGAGQAQRSDESPFVSPERTLLPPPAVELAPTGSAEDQKPLVIIDGVMTSTALADLDALDIETIEIIKGSAAAALYGSRAANGVVQITTKRGG